MGSGAGSDSGDSSGVSDTGDQGSEAANNAATDAGAASVGAGGGVSDTGDLGSEAANVSATASGAASVGAGEDPSTPVDPSPPATETIEGYVAGLDPSASPTESIRNYVDNLKANVLAQPVRSVMSPTMTALKTAAQTVLATSMLDDARFTSEEAAGDGDGTTQTIDVEAVLPYYISDQEAVPSQALAFFRGLDAPDVNILSRYGNAKQNIQNVLGDVTNQFGYGMSDQSNIFAGTLADIPETQEPITTTDFYTGTFGDINTGVSTPQTNNFFDNYLTEEGLI